MYLDILLLSDYILVIVTRRCDCHYRMGMDRAISDGATDAAA